MNGWYITIIVLSGLIYLVVFITEYSDYKFAKKRNYKIHITWWEICQMIFAPLVILCRIIFFPYDLIKDYIDELKKHGGYRGYRLWKKEEKIKEIERAREWQIKKAEDERITSAYKRNELRRDELPRELDGINNFELYGHILYGDWGELVYIENKYNATLNDFFKRHPVITLRHDIRVIYLPQCIKDISNDTILNYWNPSPTDEPLVIPNIDTSSLLKEVCYPEDISKLEHGLISCSGWSYNHGAEYLHAAYYQLKEDDDENILQQIENIAKDVYRHNTGGVYCTVSRPPKDGKPTKDFADEQFSWEVNILLDEIRERVEKLEQRGISRKILKTIIDKQRKLSRLVVTKDMRIILPDYNNIEIKMEPINKAVYLLFLRHPEGIIFKCLSDYRKELAEIYQKIKPLGLNERAIQSIEDVTNPCLNSINEKCARIRGVFVSQFDEDLAEHYYIYGKRGEPKKIALPRNLVVWEKEDV